MSEEMRKRGENFDIFVSYRRSDGKDIARILNLAFKNAGYRCFLDYNDLEGGVFGKKLENAVLDAPVFVMVLTPDYFARCNQEGDWVRKEIELALANHKIIVPINYDNVLNGVPDYLDKDFQDRIGCHNFATVFSNDSFEPTFNHVVEVRIRKVMGDLQKQTDKAQVTVVADADCTLLKNNEVIATLQADEDNYILLGKGNHLLKAQSDEFPEISVRITKNIPEVPWEDFIDVKLADKVQERRNEITEKEKAEEEAERAIIAKAKAEQERIEREKREAEQKRLALEKAERLRVERQRQQAEERRKAEEARLLEEKQRVKKLHSKVDKIKQRISWIDKYLFIILIPISILFSLGIFLYSPPPLSFQDWLLRFMTAPAWEFYLLFSFQVLIDSFKIEASDTKGIKLGFNEYNGIVVNLITPLLSILFFVFIVGLELWKCWMLFPLVSCCVFFMLFLLGILIDQIIKKLK